MNKMVKNLYEEVFIKDMDISIRTKKILILLEVFTLADLYLLYILGTIPRVGTAVKHYPFVETNLTYDEKTNNEIKELLKDYWEIEDLEHVGA
jgi:hypothetical protein